MFPQRSPAPDKQTISFALKETINVAHDAKLSGHHPFGCILLSPDNETILLRQGNINTLNHAELTLCQKAFDKYDAQYLWQCTLVTNFEPCLMCFGAIYWSNIGRVIFGMTEKELLNLTGDAEQNMTFNLSCKNLVKHGQKDIQIYGPFEEFANEIMKDHLEFWKD